MTESRPDEPFLEAIGISKRFGGVLALDEVSLQLRSGEIHCLAGENGCGKSTLISILTGVQRPDSGSLHLRGEPIVGHLSPRKSVDYGIQAIYQDLALFPELSVAENIAMASRVASRAKKRKRGTEAAFAQQIMGSLSVRTSVAARLGDLNIAERQMVAICRAMAAQARVLIMDEPTAALTRPEIDGLLSSIRSLADRGVCVVLVSHKLDEVLSVADTITVLRNGKLVTSSPAVEFDRMSLAEAMTGRSIDDRRNTDRVSEDAPPLLELVGVSGEAFDDVSFEVAGGEIVGLTGRLGSGRSEVVEAVFGLRPVTAGQIRVDGRALRTGSVRRAMEAGIGYVPEDRLTQGLFLGHSITHNLIAASLPQVSGPLGVLRGGRIRQIVSKSLEDLTIKTVHPGNAVRVLSGGNQQRVVIGKWLIRDPKVLVLNGPSVGVDIGSKERILAALRAVAKQGTAVVVVSDDAQELAKTCHRVLVMAGGRVVRELRESDLSESLLAAAVTG